MVTGAKHVFISYVTEDAGKVDRLCEVLEAGQIPYWRDRKDLGPGDSWKVKIREAIQGGTLTFLACFSQAYLARESSYMNEELTLAAEEVRRRAFGSPWLIPVRLDDVKLPYWDLGAGRTWDDFNRVDLFGNRFTREAVSLTTAIHRLMGEAAPDTETTVAAVQGAAEGDRPAQMRRLTKEMLVDPARRIALDDLISAEATQIVDAMRDEERFPSSLKHVSGPPALLELVDATNACRRLVEPLAWSMQVAVKYGEPSQLDPWTSALSRIASEAEEVKGGHTSLLSLRCLPFTLLTYTAGLAAVAADRWTTLKTLLVDNTVVTREYQQHVAPILSATDPYRPFSDTGSLGGLLAWSVQDGVDLTVEQLAEHAAAGRLRSRDTPIPDWYRAVLRPVFEEQLPDEASFDRALDRMEVALGVIDADFRLRSEMWNTRWLGQAMRRARRNPVHVVDDAWNQLEEQGERWGPLAAGLMGGSVERAQAAIARYREEFDEGRKGMGWNL